MYDLGFRDGEFCSDILFADSGLFTQIDNKHNSVRNATAKKATLQRFLLTMMYMKITPSLHAG